MVLACTISNGYASASAQLVIGPKTLSTACDTGTFVLLCPAV